MFDRSRSHEAGEPPCRRVDNFPNKQSAGENSHCTRRRMIRGAAGASDVLVQVTNKLW